MPAWLERIGIFASAPDARPPAEIVADIDAELAFHLEERARELEAQGWDRSAARAEAETRFGDVHRVRRQCARIQMGERIMLQRIQVVLTACLLVAVVLLGLSSWRAQQEVRAQRAESQELLVRMEAFAPRAVPSEPEARPDPRDAHVLLPEGPYALPDGRSSTREAAGQYWQELFDQDPTSWRHGLAVAERLAALPGSQGAEILVERLSHLDKSQREQVAKPFVQRCHPDVLRVLEALAGPLEPETSVRGRAMLDLQTFAWQDLWSGDTTFDTWMARWRDEPVTEVLRANAARWAGEVRDVLNRQESPADELRALFEVVDQVRPETFERAGLDLGAILSASLEEVEWLANTGASCDSATRQRVERVVAWCRPR